MSDFLDNSYTFYSVPMNLEDCITYLKSKVTYDRLGHYRQFIRRPLAVQIFEVNEFTIQFEIFLVVEGSSSRAYNKKGKARLSGYVQQIDSQTCQVSHKMVVQRVNYAPDIIHLLRIFLFILIPMAFIGVVDERLNLINETQWVYLLIGIFVLAVILEILLSFQTSLDNIQRLYDALPKKVEQDNLTSKVSNYVDESYEQREVNLSLEECVQYIKSKSTYYSRSPYRPLAPKSISVEISPISPELVEFEIFFVEEGRYQRSKSGTRLIGYIEQIDTNTSMIYYKLAFKTGTSADNSFIVRLILMILLASPLFLALAVFGFSDAISGILALLIFFNVILGFWIKDRQIPNLYRLLPLAQ